MQQIGRYLVRERLGRGGFAVVYRAEDTLVDTEVAIKVLAEHHADDPDIRARFVNEARVMRRIRSDRIVTIYDIAELPDGRPYMVMQLADRGTLDDRVTAVRASGARVEPADLAPLLQGVGAALAAMHDAGVVHRDVKPSNVLISTAPHGSTEREPVGTRLIRPDEYVILGDLGVAKSLESTGRLTMIAGTQAYMAPEQRVVGARIDGRTDLYAATAMVVELLAPERGSLDLSEAVEVLDVPAPLATQLRRGMAVAPADRHADAREWAEALLVASAPTAGANTQGVISASPADVGTRRWRLASLVALAAVLVTALVVTMLVVARSGGSSVSIVGPAQLAAGQTGVFYADGATGTDWSWVAPDGALRRGAELTVVAGDDDLTIGISERGDVIASRRVDVIQADPEVRITGPSSGRVDDTIELLGLGPEGSVLRWTVRGEQAEGDRLTLRLHTSGVVQVDLRAVVGSTEHRTTHWITVLPP